MIIHSKRSTITTVHHLPHTTTIERITIEESITILFQRRMTVSRTIDNVRNKLSMLTRLVLLKDSILNLPLTLSQPPQQSPRLTYQRPPTLTDNVRETNPA